MTTATKKRNAAKALARSLRNNAWQVGRKPRRIRRLHGRQS